MHGKYGTMKLFKIIIFLVLTGLMSCQKDVLINDCTLAYPGLLCKSFFFEGENCIGYTENEYNSNLQKIKTIYKSTAGKAEKTIEYTYNCANLIVEEHIYGKNNALKEVILYKYTPSDLLEKASHFVDGNETRTITHIYLSDNKLEETQVLTQGALDTVIRFEYDTRNKLWRKSYYTKDNALLQYQIHEYFDNNIERIKFYNAKDIYQGYHMLQFNEEMKSLIFITYDRENKIVEKLMFEYEDGFLIGIEKKDAYNTIKSKIIHFYSY